MAIERVEEESPTIPRTGGVLMFSSFFVLSLPSIWFLLLCFRRLALCYLLPFLHSLLYLFALGILAIIKVFLHPSSPFSIPLISLHLSLHCPLIFMQLAGQPCSASLSLSVGEEAA